MLVLRGVTWALGVWVMNGLALLDVVNHDYRG